MGENGFYSPSSPLDKAVITELQGLCPCFGKQLADMDENRVWGRRESSFLAYSSNSEIRYNASSGGVLTSICSYLVETKRVEGIFHIGKDPDDPSVAKCIAAGVWNRLLAIPGLDILHLWRFLIFLVFSVQEKNMPLLASHVMLQL